MPTLGAANAPPAVGPLVITELMYNPPAGHDEYVELQNTGTEALSLSEPSLDTHTWKIDGMGFAFPPSTTLAPGEVVLVIPAGVDETAVRAAYDVPPAARIFAGAATLSDLGETLTLMKAWKPYQRAMQEVLPFIVMETVAFTTTAPWPPEANGLGSALQRRDVAAYGNDPASWQAASPTPGRVP